MTATEQLRANPKYLDRLNFFLTEDEVGTLFLKALTEKVLGVIPTGHDQANHGTIFRSGFSSGAASVLAFVQGLDPIAVAEDLHRKAAEGKLKEPLQLPSQRIAQMERQNPGSAKHLSMPPPPAIRPAPPQ